MRKTFKTISFSGFVTTLPNDFTKHQKKITAFWNEVTTKHFDPLYRHVDEHGVVGVFFNETDTSIDYLVGIVGDVRVEGGTVISFNNLSFKGKKQVGPLPSSMRELVIEVETENRIKRPSFESYVGEDSTIDKYESIYYYMTKE